MTPERLHACIAALGWSRRLFGAVLGYPETTVRDWMRGRLPIPDAVADWLEERMRRELEHPR